MTASTFSILQTDLDRIAAQIQFSEEHQEELEARLQRLRPCEGSGFQGVLGKFFIPNQSKITMAGSNKFGIEEVVDTSTDAITFVQRMIKALADGFQMNDLFVLLAEYPKLIEMYTDRRTFVMEFLDQTPEEAHEALARIAENTKTEVGAVREKSIAALRIAAKVYELFDATVDGVKEVIEEGKVLFAA